MARILGGFPGISVRDQKSLRLVQACSPDLAKTTILVPDPTLAFNLLEVFNGSASLVKLRTHGFDEEIKWALLVIKKGEVSRMALHVLKQNGYRVAAT